ncbi:MAG: hypothetical protein ACE5EE_11095 [Fidelibacterota bacterium]
MEYAETAIVFNERPDGRSLNGRETIQTSPLTALEQLLTRGLGDAPTDRLPPAIPATTPDSKLPTPEEFDQLVTA